MSAEGKKARGEAGKKNAENRPFRLGGRHADYSIGRGSSAIGGGSRMLHAFQFGYDIRGIYPFDVTQRMVNFITKEL